jgi:protein TonB
MKQSLQASNSTEYLYTGTQPRSDFFVPLMLLSLILFGGSGWYMRTHNPPPVSIPEQLSKMQETRFIMDEPKPAPKIEKPRPIVEKKIEPPIPQEPIDLTKQPLLNQPENDIIDNPAPPPPDQKPVRRVYGLKRVYSTGIGASGSMSDAVIGKIGNTLNTNVDTITATANDLKSAPVSITTITTPPRTKHTIKPEYTKEMLDNRIEGVVRVKVLIDIDGKVKRLIFLDDLGFGSREKVTEAVLQWLFEPALIGSQPVSTWIPLTVRFELQNG